MYTSDDVSLLMKHPFIDEGVGVDFVKFNPPGILNENISVAPI